MRLVTRGDLDGLTCALIITTCEKIDEILLIHPQDITDKKVEITRQDILANLPYHPDCGKWFDHHLLTDSNERPPQVFEGKYGLAPSAASMAWEYYRPEHAAIQRFEKMLHEADRFDSAQLEVADVLDPKAYILLGYTLDPRSGLGAFQEYFKLLVNALKSKPIEEVLNLPEVEARIKTLRQQDGSFREAILSKSRLEGNVVITDFRDVDPPPVGNRFLIYTIFPQANISLRIHWGPRRAMVAVAVGHSIFNRTSRTNVGTLMSQYGGGGHRGAGTCLISPGTADQQIAEMVAAIKKDG